MIPTVSWKDAIDTEVVIRDVLPHLKDDQVRDYIKEVGLVWEIYTVTYNDFTWDIMRSHTEIQDFILAYNLKFKEKLTFGSFKHKGLQTICNNESALAWPALHQFLDTRDYELGKIGSFDMMKKSGGRFKQFCCHLPWQWTQKLIIITPAGVMYYNQPSKDIKEYIPFNSRIFRIIAGKEQTDMEFGIQLQASHRKLLLYSEKAITFFRFVYTVKEALKERKGHHQNNRYQSFASIRKLRQVEFLVDGEEYFMALAESLERAQWQILITDWWLSPEFQLRRPVGKYADKRFDRVIQKAASRGVKIFILVFKESPTFLPTDSAYVQQRMQSLSPNIKVLRHPLGVLPSFWSHHQKVAIVDQSQALMGGFDICYGRWDDHVHSVVDNDQGMYPGIQYNNQRIIDFTNVRQYWNSDITRDQPRMPWHDIGVRISGDPVQDLCHHFIQYWNYASFQIHNQDRYVLILDPDRSNQPLIKRIQQGITQKLNDIKQYAEGLRDKLFASGINSQSSSNTGRGRQQGQRRKSTDYLNDEHKTDVDPSSNRDMKNGKLNQDKKGGFKPTNSKTVRPGEKEPDSTPSSNTNTNGHNKEQTQELKRQMEKYDAKGTGKQIKAKNKYKHQMHDARKTLHQLQDQVHQMEITVGKIDYFDDLRLTNNRHKLAIIGQEGEEFNCQVLRSVGGWSIGCDPSMKENSIYNCYIGLIENAQNYIYIENQFFISAVQGIASVQNQIGNTIAKRIIRAHKQKKPFKVVAVIPLIPGFAGQLDDQDAILPRVIMHWQYAAICRHQNSIMNQLKRQGIDPHQYIAFFGLRNHGMLHGPKTQIIYIHTKMMIVDDNKLIIGSANINDRSQRGSRDSELAICVEGKSLRKVQYSNRTDEVCDTIKKLRIKLYLEHFGPNIDFDDPASEDAFRQIQLRTKANTKIYRQLFNCYPDDRITNFKIMKQWRQFKINEEMYKQLSPRIEGHAVQWPLQFLNQEDLAAGSALYPDSLSV